MSFQTGLSGLSASSRSLDVIGNNIANANTVGMKSSRAEFGDLIASSLGAGGGGSNGTAGIGVAVAAVAQQFTQGNINITGNALDVAINGSGFFQLSKSADTTQADAYSRDGQFKMDVDGNIRTNTGAYVLGYQTDVDGVPDTSGTVKLNVPTAAGIEAKATDTITAELNLDSRAPVAANETPPTPTSKYGTSVTTYDTQGNEVVLNMFFVRTDDGTATGSDVWDVYSDSEGTNLIGQMSFGADGKQATPLVIDPYLIATPSATTPDISTKLDFSNVTQYGASFAVTDLTQNGYAPGELTSVSIEADGVITARYSNGETQANGQLILADFRNVQGLTPTGNGEYLRTFASGEPVLGAPDVGKFGALRSGALEESNVDLTAELVNMMTAQRAYQANAQTIKTQDQIMSTLVNLR